MTEPPLPPELNPRGPQAAPEAARARRRPGCLKLLLLGLLVLLLLAAGVLGGTYIWANGRLDKVAAIAPYAGRPADGPGTNWLLVGSDSRAGLTGRQQQDLHVGSDAGVNTDTIIVLHKGAHGPVLMSIPRDSYVTIPAWTDSKGVTHAAHKDKINAAYASGGAPLLVRTVETTTGIRMDHYVEVGFTGIVDVVNALGGVPICLDQPIKDSRSGADLPAGCQTLNGVQSLELVRTRYSLPNSDLSRIQNQQAFLKALGEKALSPGTTLNPFRLYPFLSASLDALTVDRASSVWTLGQFALQMQSVAGSSGRSLTVPLASENYTTPSGASAVLWSSSATKLFQAIQGDRALP
ncbi:LCP family protein [Streptacidiphilus rugosus]|uniref:LCP family protein n=1 Tax=Streptacidiphilus rugosus TaxID=405783 RepID=UPI00068D8FB6|nr:LCP family protein [Streptacidiphilus rugosus]